VGSARGLVLGLAAAACGRAPDPGPATDAVVRPAQAPDVVIVLLGGLRADPPGGTAAEEALYRALGRAPDVRFDAAYVQSIAPSVSLGSLLAGRPPSAVPLCGLPAGGEDDLPWCASVPDDVPTLPGVLGLYGWRTALFGVGFPRLDVPGRSFSWSEAVPERAGADGADWGLLGERVRAWWEGASAASRLAVLYVDDLDLAGRPDVPGGGGPPRLWQALGRLGSLPRPGGPGEGAAQPGDAEAAIARLAEEAGAAGSGLAGLLGGLGWPGPEGPWVILSSTHGCNLAEGSGAFAVNLDHVGGDVLLDRTMRVPLALFEPGGEGPTRRVADVVELVDLVPTVLRIAGAVPPAGAWGRDLTAAEPEPGASAYCEYGDMLALRRDRFLLVFRSLQHGHSTLDPEVTVRLRRQPVRPGAFTLHDVVSDPLQRHDLAASDPATLALMRDLLVASRGRAEAAAEVRVTPKRLWDLRMSPSRGYW